MCHSEAPAADKIHDDFRKRLSEQSDRYVEKSAEWENQNSGHGTCDAIAKGFSMLFYVAHSMYCKNGVKIMCTAITLCTMSAVDVPFAAFSLS